jgi:hypothetical protein
MPGLPSTARKRPLQFLAGYDVSLTAQVRGVPGEIDCTPDEALTGEMRKLIFEHRSPQVRALLVDPQGVHQQRIRTLPLNATRIAAMPEWLASSVMCSSETGMRVFR